MKEFLENFGALIYVSLNAMLIVDFAVYWILRGRSINRWIAFRKYDQWSKRYGEPIAIFPFTLLMTATMPASLFCLAFDCLVFTVQLFIPRKRQSNFQRFKRGKINV